MVTFFEWLRVRDGVWLRAQSLILFFSLLDRIPFLKRYRKSIWDLVKVELYYIGGQCRHSGMCCKGLNLVIRGTRMETMSEFKGTLEAHPEYQRFVPQLDSGGEIDHFSCSCLMPNNWCSDYENRPKLCRQYPMSAFIAQDHIIQGCGYEVRRRHFRFQLWVPNNIEKQLRMTDALNRILP